MTCLEKEKNLRIFVVIVGIEAKKKNVTNVRNMA